MDAVSYLDEMEPVRVGHRLRVLRKAAKLTQDEVAELCGVTYQQVSGWERGTTVPPLRTVAPLLMKYDVTSDYVFFGRVYTLKVERAEWLAEAERRLAKQ